MTAADLLEVICKEIDAAYYAGRDMSDWHTDSEALNAAIAAALQQATRNGMVLAANRLLEWAGK